MVLSSNRPNPFSSGTVFALDLWVDADLGVDVLDVRGRIVRRMNLGHRGVGTTPMSFDDGDAEGPSLPNGVYFYSLHANGAASR